MSLQGPKTHYSKFKIFVCFVVISSHLVRCERKQHRERREKMNIPWSDIELKEKKLKSVERGETNRGIQILRKVNGNGKVSDVGTG